MKTSLAANPNLDMTFTGRGPVEDSDERIPKDELEVVSDFLQMNFLCANETKEAATGSLEVHHVDDI